MTTSVLAFFPGQEAPVAFQVPGGPAGKAATLATLRQHFPLRGEFHWRVKMDHPEFDFVWKDLCVEHEPVPSFKNVGVVVKGLPLEFVDEDLSARVNEVPLDKDYVDVSKTLSSSNVSSARSTPSLPENAFPRPLTIQQQQQHAFPRPPPAEQTVAPTSSSSSLMGGKSFFSSARSALEVMKKNME